MSTPAATTFEEALEEVHTRFILNLPDSELQTADRIFFQLEQAWWFYEDLICDPHPEWNLTRFSNLKPFCLQMFEFSPLLPDPSKFPAMWSAFTQYKRTISNYGCVLLNRPCTHAILCRVWNGKSYTFPSGKINQGEDGNAAAARETYEETGFDPAAKFGTTAEWRQHAPEKITWDTTLADQDALVFTEDSGKRRTAFVVVGVPEDFPFEPVARKEVSDVSWHPIDDFPKCTFAVTPFIGPLRKWIKKYKKRNNQKTTNIKGGSRSTSHTPQTTPNRRRNKSNANTPNRSRTRSRGRVTQEGDDVVAMGLAQAGDASGWSEEDMFRANEKLIGRKVEYDGNPHIFSEQGLAGNDPHAFRVVGGNFLNEEQQPSLASPPPDSTKLQPLLNWSKMNSKHELTPFFSDQGATPWGEVVTEARGDISRPASKASAKPKSTRDKESQYASSTTTTATSSNIAQSTDVSSDIFPTDGEITARSQAAKTWANPNLEAVRLEIHQDKEYIRRWVDRLPKPKSTAMFGEFRLNVDNIMVEVNRALRLGPDGNPIAS